MVRLHHRKLLLIRSHHSILLLDRYLQLSGGTINGSVTITNNLTVNGNIYGNKVYNAVWNDFAELRE